MRSWLVNAVAPPALVVVVVLLSATSVVALLAAGHVGRTAGVTVGPQATSPSPGALPEGGSGFQLNAPSSGVAWALYAPFKLYRSTDGGTSWELRGIPKEWGAQPTIAFISDREGWWLAPGTPTGKCQDSDAMIWHTTDGGATWLQLPAKGIAAGQCKSYIWFADAKRGFIGASDETHPATIYRTSDGGNTWAATRLLPDPPNYQSAQGGAGYQVTWIKLFGSTFYLGALGTPYVYRSIDSGASWKWFTKVPSPALVMVTETRWLDLVGPGQILESTNGGQQFHQYASDLQPIDPNAAQLVFPDAKVGFAAGAGRLQRTTDGGKGWTQLPPPGLGNVLPIPTPTPPPTNVRLSAPSLQVVWALVGGQSLFRSTDQGATWQQEGLPAASSLTDLSFVDDSDGWVLLAGPGEGQCSFGTATVWRTSDAGAHWNVVAQTNSPTASASRSSSGLIGFGQCKENLSFVDRQRGFVDAYDENGAPTIYRTSDGGGSWSPSRLPDPAGFSSGGGYSLRAGVVKAFGSRLLVEASGMQADGAHSYVFSSSDGGATWRSLDTPAPTTSQNNVAFATATRWLRIGNDGSGQETTDSGLTWHSFTGDYLGDPNAPSFFVFVDASVGYGTVDGAVRRADDGGIHWVLIKTTWP